MKRKLLISLAGVFGFLLGGLFITSFVLAKKLRDLAEQRKDDPFVVDRGVIPAPKTTAYKFKHEVCDYFPVKIFSDTEEDKSYGKAICDVTFRGEKLALIYSPTYLKDILSIYDSFIMKDLREKTAREKIEMIFESRGPGDVKFLLTRHELQQSLLYLLNGMHRKFKTWDKFTSGKYLIYSWDITRGSFKENKVQLFTDQDSMTCMGVTCMDYFFQAGIL